MNSSSLEIPQQALQVLSYLNITNPILLGKGGEGWIFDYHQTEVVKIYKEATQEYLEKLVSFQQQLAQYSFSFDTSYIKQIGEVNGTFYTIEKKLSGQQLDTLIPDLNSPQRKLAYQNYYDAIKQINSIEPKHLPFGQIIHLSDSITAPTWSNFLLMKLAQKLEKYEKRLRNRITDYDSKVKFFQKLLSNDVQPQYQRLVHADYYLNNVLVNSDLKISAVLDLSIHACVGDPRLDVAGVLTWNDLTPGINPEDYEFLYKQAAKDYGPDLDYYIDLYRLYTAFYYSDIDNEKFSVKNLNNQEVWDRLGFN